MYGIPLELLQFLLVLTFFLHVVPMNLLLGGALLAAASHLRARKDPRHLSLARVISRQMPAVVALTVTLGVAPLLFAQVLYGHLLYSSSILMARAWFLVVPLVILGYYGAYLLKFRWDRLQRSRGPLAWIVALVFSLVGFIYSNNFSLMLRPETWRAIYFEDPGGGSLNWSDPSLYPRYLHMLLGAVAVAGLWVLLIGARRRAEGPEWSAWAQRYGGRVFLHATSLNIFVGFWFLLAVPRRAMLAFMGESPLATGAFVASLALLVPALVFILKASRGQPTRIAVLGAGSLAGVLALMAVMRQELRTAYLDPAFRIEELQVAPQWGVFALFVLVLLAGVGTVAWLVSVALRAGVQPAPSD